MYETKHTPPKNPSNLLNDTSKPRRYMVVQSSTPSLELDQQGWPLHKPDELLSALNSTQHTTNERARGWVFYQGGE